MREQALARRPVKALDDYRRYLFHDVLAWEVHLSAVQIEGPRHRRIATEGALLGELAARGLHERLAIVSDDAGQLNVLRHGLCWIHAECLIHTLPITIRSSPMRTSLTMKPHDSLTFDRIKDIGGAG